MIADILSLSRIGLSILLVILSKNPYLALGIIILAGLTDIFDGFLSHKFGESKYGIYIDVIADRFFILAVFVSLVLYYNLNILYAILLLSRDIAVGIILPISYLIKWKMKLPKSRLSGRLATFVVFIAFTSVIFNFHSGIFIIIAIAVSFFSALDYLIFYFPHS